MGSLLDQIKGLPEFELREIRVDGAPRNSERFVAVCEKGSLEPISVVTRRYRLLQMSEVFEKVLKAVGEDSEGEVHYYNGRAVMYVFPRDTGEIDGMRIGVAVANSVDQSSALRLQFILSGKETKLYLPSVGRMRSYRRLHVGNIGAEFAKVAEQVAQVSALWKPIIAGLSGMKSSAEDVELFKKTLGKKLGQKLDGYVASYRLYHGGEMPDIWSLTLEAMKIIAQGTTARKKAGAGYRLQEKVRRLSALLLSYAIETAKKGGVLTI